MICQSQSQKWNSVFYLQIMTTAHNYNSIILFIDSSAALHSFWETG